MQRSTRSSPRPKVPLQEFLKRRHPAWNLVGRVHFNLAENRKDEEAPFAFLATYTTRLSAQAKAQHLPLGKALQEYAGAKNRERLLSLLMPVQRAAEQCAWLKRMVDAGEIFHPLRWTPPQALQFLKDVSGARKRRRGRAHAGELAHEPAGAPAGEGHGRRQARRRSSDWMRCSTSAWMSRSTARRSRPPRSGSCLAQTDGLAFIRGHWVEVDRERLGRTLEQFEAVERRAAAEGLSFGEAMRMLAGAGIAEETASQADVDWSQTVAGPWLAETLAAMRRPDGRLRADPGPALHGTLRPYQQAGVHWLHLLTRLGLGACLADDMGLGKTIQVLSLLLVLKTRGRWPRASRRCWWCRPRCSPTGRRRSPAFAPSLKARRGPSFGDCRPTGAKTDGARDLAGVDLVITSYGSLLRAPWLADDGVATW